MALEKVLFVICYTDEELIKLCVSHIHKLYIPEGIEIQLLTIKKPLSITKGYNEALQYDAKYKVYLHQDTFIINKNIIKDLIDLFLQDPKLGLIGTIGCVKLPSSGSWWHGNKIVGKIIGYNEEGAYFTTTGEPIYSSYCPVETVDGYFMATQYDISWREDIIEGFHFYDVSQTIEFINRGYTVGVAKQESPWCMHVNLKNPKMMDEEDYRYHQKKFLGNYDLRGILGG